MNEFSCFDNKKETCFLKTFLLASNFGAAWLQVFKYYSVAFGQIIKVRLSNG